jgi:hypothetical protein
MPAPPLRGRERPAAAAALRSARWRPLAAVCGEGVGTVVAVQMSRRLRRQLCPPMPVPPVRTPCVAIVRGEEQRQGSKGEELQSSAAHNKRQPQIERTSGVALAGVTTALTAGESVARTAVGCATSLTVRTFRCAGCAISDLGTASSTCAASSLIWLSAALQPAAYAARPTVPACAYLSSCLIRGNTRQSERATFLLFKTKWNGHALSVSLSIDLCVCVSLSLYLCVCVSV